MRPAVAVGRQLQSLESDVGCREVLRKSNLESGEKRWLLRAPTRLEL